jgi:hypothetical protein
MTLAKRTGVRNKITPAMEHLTSEFEQFPEIFDKSSL